MLTIDSQYIVWIKFHIKYSFCLIGWITSRSIINNTNKTFKTDRIFLDEYLYKSNIDEREKILNRIKSDNAIKYYSGNTLKQIATYLDINIIVIFLIDKIWKI